MILTAKLKRIASIAQLNPSTTTHLANWSHVSSETMIEINGCVLGLDSALPKALEDHTEKRR